MAHLNLQLGGPPPQEPPIETEESPGMFDDLVEEMFSQEPEEIVEIEEEIPLEEKIEQALTHDCQEEIDALFEGF